MLLIGRCRRRLTGIIAGVRRATEGHLWVRPVGIHATGTGTHLLRSRAELLAENAVCVLSSV